MSVQGINVNKIPNSPQILCHKILPSSVLVTIFNIMQVGSLYIALVHSAVWMSTWL